MTSAPTRPGGQLVLYYRDVPCADGIVILGHLADDRDIDRLAASSEVTIEAVRRPARTAAHRPA
ncbi:hypothetical protein [Streptomyces nogalater]|uniref:Cyclophilin-like domain-containing protein n=1 Tax=Streptomyces nogalater TaxID=38314 RepID=A0ABW0WJJ5_STRNO